MWQIASHTALAIIKFIQISTLLLFLSNDDSGVGVSVCICVNVDLIDSCVGTETIADASELSTAVNVPNLTFNTSLHRDIVIIATRACLTYFAIQIPILWQITRHAFTTIKEWLSRWTISRWVHDDWWQ